jgi:membrane protein YdbS with pleckstrin-like domain
MDFESLSNVPIWWLFDLPFMYGKVYVWVMANPTCSFIPTSYVSGCFLIQSLFVLKQTILYDKL